jgi:HlyD family secretion protein
MKIILSVLVGIVIVCVVFMYYHQDRPTDQLEFRTLPVTRGELFVGVTATGIVEPVRIIDVGTQIDGSIRSFGPDSDRPGETIDYRSRVKKGDVLARLDNFLQQTELDRARAQVRIIQAELRIKKARQNQAKLALSRARKLRGSDPRAEYDRAIAEEVIAKTEVALSEAKLNDAKIAVRQAEINLGYTVIRSPVDGEIIDRRVNIGQTVVSGVNAPSLFLLAENLDQMLVWSAVNEADIDKIHVGQPVTFTVDAFREHIFSGKVSQIRLNASQQQNVVTYGVIVDVDNTDGKLLPYMTAKLQFEVARREDVVRVPNQALRWKPPQLQETPSAQSPLEAEEGASDSAEPKPNHTTLTVWAKSEDGLVSPVRVQVGLSDGMMTEILKGALKPGDTVVIGTVQKTESDFVSSFLSQVMEIAE